ncbi:MAG: DUF1616 domain-containing protein [Candidatus Bathyarchaeia archaeon]|jgi:hypothetical protein
MKLEDYKQVFAAVGLVGVLLFATPALGLVVHLPSGEKFSELYVLGSGHMAEDYPFNVRENESYLVYLGVDNHLSSSAYYEVIVKFANQSESLPDTTAGVPSSLPGLYEYRVFLQDGQSWEQPLTFSFSQVSAAQNRSVVGGLRVNGVTLSVEKPEVWDDGNGGYFYEVFMELWIYNVASDAFQFHNRFVGLWLNVTAS